MARRGKRTSVERLISESFAIEAEEAREADAIGFMARAMVQATLPHRKVDGNEFERRNGSFVLSMIAPSSVGLPYGAIPRLLMAWMTTEAVRTRSRELVLGDSLSGFMRDLDMVPTGGRWGSITRLKSQTKRLFASSVSAVYEDADQTAMLRYGIADRAVLWWDARRPDQAALWQSTVTLTEAFYSEVIERPVPIDMRALKALKKSPLAIDIYTWLTYRQSYLKRQTVIPWPALAAQFGSDYALLRQFRAAFLAELRKVQVIYPVEVETGSGGLVLKPAAPHVRRLR